MIHYHGGPITPIPAAIQCWTRGHAMVSFAYPDQLPIAAEVAQSFALDNGAFTEWKQGRTPNWDRYADWIREWWCHPGFDWCLIPDSIDGDEFVNDALLDWWITTDLGDIGVPVWHLHESLGRLTNLVARFQRVALGSSGEYADVGTAQWWGRMAEAMDVACFDDGRPKTKLHGLRMLDPTIFSHLPLSSADSTNVARNIGIDGAWRGPYTPATKETRALILAERIERHASAATWNRATSGTQQNLELIG